MKAMIEKILENRLWVLGATLAVIIAGAVSIPGIPIDAVPDITGVQVLVNTRTGGLDPERIERTVTFPIEAELTGIPGLEQIRSISRFGLSQVVVTFADGADIWKARQQIGERLSAVRDALPEGLNPELAPVTTGLGEVLIYTLRAESGSALTTKTAKEQLVEMRTIQDFVVRPALKRVPGVADIDTNGGFKKEIHINLIPGRMEALGVSFAEILRATQGIGDTSGGGYIQKDGNQIIVRAGATMEGITALASLPVRLDVFGNPIRLSQIARVAEGHAIRIGAATSNGEECLLGTVLMLTGENSRQVAHDAEQAIKKIPLPNGVKIEVLYSRAFLVDATIGTVEENLGLGAALVIAVLLLFLGNVRAAVLVALAIPVSMFAAAAGMKYAGLSANLMSLGAVDFGLLVDASIVIVDNVSRKMETSTGTPLTPAMRFSLVRDAVFEVARPVAFGIAIIMLVYVPILSFTGIEGKMFRPMALTVLMAIGASLVVALCVMPALVYLLLRPPKKTGDSLAFRVTQRLYDPLLQFVMRWRIAAVLVAVLAFAAAVAVFARMGSDFIPELDEGDLIINITRSTNIGIDRAVVRQKQAEAAVMKFPEVERVFSRLGTNEAATDPMGINYADTFIILKKDRKAWPLVDGRRRSKDDLYKAMQEAITKESADDELAPTQPIQMRFNEILEGSRADVTLRIVGPDLEKLVELVEKAEEIVKPIPGAQEVEMDALTSLRKSTVLDIRPDSPRMAMYGVQLRELNEIFETAMAGRAVGSYYETDRRFPVVVRLDEAVRNDPLQVRQIPVELPEGGTVPLDSLSRIEQREQVTTIARFYGQRYAALAMFLSGRDVDSFVREAKDKVKRELPVPDGYRLEWGGQFENLAKARLRLAVVVPITLALIFILLLRELGSVRHSVLVYTAIPFAVTGGVFALAVRGIPFSISAAVGFIAVSGIAILNGIVLMHFIKELRASGRTAFEAAVEGAGARLRPVIMTALVASLGFVPMALNTGIGAEVQRPLATVVIGGLVTSTFLTMFLLPMLYAWFERDKGVRPDD